MRVQLALNVRNLDEAIDYYGKLFGAPVNKRKPGYANFAIDQPPLKLVLLEVPDAPERLNHLGVEVFEQGEVDAAVARLSAAGIAGKIETDSTCCHAVQNKIWSSDPQGARWEFYRVIADSETFAAPSPEAPAVAGGCGCA
jgi:catechol 2,3-dioxygenase-like lactoylglutathione lyase family enzyme